MENIIFGASEYVKDGLLPLTEYLGPSPCSWPSVTWGITGITIGKQDQGNRSLTIAQM